MKINNRLPPEIIKQDLQVFPSTRTRKMLLRMSRNLRRRKINKESWKISTVSSFHTLFSCQVQESDNKSPSAVFENHCQRALSAGKSFMSGKT